MKKRIPILAISIISIFVLAGAVWFLHSRNSSGEQVGRSTVGSQGGAVTQANADVRPRVHPAELSRVEAEQLKSYESNRMANAERTAELIKTMYRNPDSPEAMQARRELASQPVSTEQQAIARQKLAEVYQQSMQANSSAPSIDPTETTGTNPLASQMNTPQMQEHLARRMAMERALRPELNRAAHTIKPGDLATYAPDRYGELLQARAAREYAGMPSTDTGTTAGQTSAVQRLAPRANTKIGTQGLRLSREALKSSSPTSEQLTRKP